MKTFVAALVLTLLTCGNVQAQPVYRCGNEYSHTFCPGGKLLEATDPRSAAHRAEALRVAELDRRRAAEMERERRAQERAEKPAKATGFNGRPAPRDEAASSAEQGKSKKQPKTKPDKAFVAVEPAQPKVPRAK